MTTDHLRPAPAALKGVVLPLALLAAGMIGLGFLVTHVLVHAWPLALEDQVVSALVAARTPALDRASNQVSLFAYVGRLVAVTVAAGGLMRIAYRRWREALFLATALIAQGVIYKITVRVVSRARPSVPRLDNFPPMQSFFSGHVSAAVALYGGIAVVLAMHSHRRARTVIRWILLLLIPVAVAISRMYRGEHHLSDVAASFVSGFGCVWILKRAMLTPLNREDGSSHELQDGLPDHQSSCGRAYRPAD